MRNRPPQATLRPIVPILFIVLATSSLTAQNAPPNKIRAEVFGGYSVLDDTVNLDGWNASAIFFLSDWFGLGFDVSGHGEKAVFRLSGPERTLLLEEDRDVHHFLFGGQFPLRYKRFTAFGRLMAGAAHVDVGRTPLLDLGFPMHNLSDTDFIFSTGGGVDIRLKHPLSLRIFQYDYVIDPGSDTDFRFSTGIVFSF